MIAFHCWQATSRLVIAASLAVSMSFAIGCSNPESFCVPPPLSITPDPAIAGTVVVVSAGRVACRLGQIDQYSFTLVADDGSIRQVLGTTQPAPDGQFAVSLTLPNHLPAGTYVIEVAGDVLEKVSTADTGPGKSESVASCEKAFAVIAAS